MAPLMSGRSFFEAIRLVSSGIIGEYIGAIPVQARNRPLAVEEELLDLPPRKDEDDRPRFMPKPARALRVKSMEDEGICSELLVAELRERTPGLLEYAALPQ